MEKLFLFLGQFLNLTDALREALLSKIYIQKVKKGDVIVSEGKVCNQLFFIRKGFLRGYHCENGKEITTWFGFENDFATSTYSFISRKTGLENIEAVEDSTLYVISHRDLTEIYQNFPEFNYVGRLLTERYYVDLMERTLLLQYQSAGENYRQFVETHPHILMRACLGHIASYLGISQETLSRIRAKKMP